MGWYATAALPWLPVAVAADRTGLRRAGGGDAGEDRARGAGGDGRGGSGRRRGRCRRCVRRLWCRRCRAHGGRRWCPGCRPGCRDGYRGRGLGGPALEGREQRLAAGELGDRVGVDALAPDRHQTALDQCRQLCRHRVLPAPGERHQVAHCAPAVDQGEQSPGVRTGRGAVGDGGAQAGHRVDGRHDAQQSRPLGEPAGPVGEHLGRVEAETQVVGVGLVGEERELPVRPAQQLGDGVDHDDDRDVEEQRLVDRAEVAEGRTEAGPGPGRGGHGLPQRRLRDGPMPTSRRPRSCRVRSARAPLRTPARTRTTAVVLVLAVPSRRSRRAPVLPVLVSRWSTSGRPRASSEPSSLTADRRPGGAGWSPEAAREDGRIRAPACSALQSAS